MKETIKYLQGYEFTTVIGIEHSSDIAYAAMCVESGFVVYGSKKQQCVWFKDTRNIDSTPITIRNQDKCFKLISFTGALLYPELFSKKTYESITRIECSDEEFLQQYTLELNEHSEVVLTEFALDRKVLAKITMSKDSTYLTTTAMGYAFNALRRTK